MLDTCSDSYSLFWLHSHYCHIRNLWSSAGRYNKLCRAPSYLCSLQWPSLIPKSRSTQVRLSTEITPAPKSVKKWMQPEWNTAPPSPSRSSFIIICMLHADISCNCHDWDYYRSKFHKLIDTSSSHIAEPLTPADYLHKLMEHLRTKLPQQTFQIGVPLLSVVTIEVWLDFATTFTELSQKYSS